MDSITVVCWHAELVEQTPDYHSACIHINSWHASNLIEV